MVMVDKYRHIPRHQNRISYDRPQGLEKKILLLNRHWKIVFQVNWPPFFILCVACFSWVAFLALSSLRMSSFWAILAMFQEIYGFFTFTCTCIHRNQESLWCCDVTGGSASSNDKVDTMATIELNCSVMFLYWFSLLSVGRDRWFSSIVSIVNRYLIYNLPEIGISILW